VRGHRELLMARMVRWSGLRDEDARAILAKVEERAAALKLRFVREEEQAALMDLAALATALAMDFAYTGQLLD
jgi:predicted Fe-S protein YdhL (DUF1289 family)